MFQPEECFRIKGFTPGETPFIDVMESIKRNGVEFDQLETSDKHDIISLHGGESPFTVAEVPIRHLILKFFDGVLAEVVGVFDEAQLPDIREAFKGHFGEDGSSNWSNKVSTASLEHAEKKGDCVFRVRHEGQAESLDGAQQSLADGKEKDRIDRIRKDV